MSIASTAATIRAGNGAIVGNWMLLAGNVSDQSQLVDLTTLASVTTYNYNVNSIMWTSTVTADGKKLYNGGWDGAFFSYNPLTPLVVPVMDYRFHNSTSSVIRDAVFVIENSKDVLYTSRGGTIDVWDVTSTTAPILTKSLIFDITTGDGYAIKVNVATHRAYVANTGGWFYVINTDMIPAAASTPPAY